MKYIHPDDGRIARFAAEVCKENNGLEAVCRNILAWFEENVEYSRLSAPFDPLQRSDLDVLDMRAGTCGDFANLIVSALLSRGFDAGHAYVHRDLYGDAQDHICASVNDRGRHILIDAAMPYRKWHGYDCKHLEYDFLSPAEFETRMTEEEAYWRSFAAERGRPMLAGLLYAPWMHAERVFETGGLFCDVFYLLTLDEKLEPEMCVYYRRYTKAESALPVMAKVSCGKTIFHFSIYPRSELWDDGQWSPGFEEADIPVEHASDELRSMKASMRRVLPRIGRILSEAGLENPFIN